MDILTAGFPCFVKDTKVITHDGVKNIQDVSIDDKLLTHAGKFQPINNIQKKSYDGQLYEIHPKYHPYPIVCTEDHPFYVRKQQDNNFDVPEWVNAKNLDDTYFYGMCINQNSIIPSFTCEDPKDIKATLLLNVYEEKQWYTLGYFLGELMEYPSVLKNEEEYNDLIISKIENITKKKFGKFTPLWITIFKEFGEYSSDKKIPEWVHDAPISNLHTFMNGYIDGNFSRRKNKKIIMLTKSQDIAFSLQRIFMKLGHIFDVKYGEYNEYNVIDSGVYTIKGKYNKSTDDAFIEGNYVWYKLNSIKTKNTVNETVYNFEVDIDNSYCVQNVLVHNCQPFSIAGKQEGFEDERSNVFWTIIKILKKYNPQCVVLENVKNLQSHDEGKTYTKIIESLTKLKYHIKTKILNTSKVTNIPQNRERIYIVCFKDKEKSDKFEFPAEIDGINNISEYIDNNIDDKYYYTDKMAIWDKLQTVTKNISENTVYQYRRYYVRENKNSVCPTLTANMGTGGHNVPIIRDNKGIRKLTPKECFKLQGFPNNFILPKLSDGKLYKQAGNAVTVSVVEKVANEIVKILG